MKKIALMLILLTISSVSFPLVSLESEEGENRLISSLSSGYGEQFLKEVRYFVHQDNLSYCGVATATIILNTLLIEAPKDKNFKNYKIFTQENMLKKIPLNLKEVQPSYIFAHGLTLYQEKKLLELFGNVKIDTYFSNKLSEVETRKIIVSALKTNKLLVVANVLRSALGEAGGGHFSPVVAYDPKTDSVLFLDVASYKYPPVWVTFSDLYRAMHTQDHDTMSDRGFLIVSKSWKA